MKESLVMPALFIPARLHVIVVGVALVCAGF
jgi:hypothetical protein